jgi:hypothetical protein
VWSSAASPAGEGPRSNPSVYASEQSDRPIVPGKPSNKAPSAAYGCGHGAAEMVEGRGLTEGNLLEFDRYRTQ